MGEAMSTLQTFGETVKVVGIWGLVFVVGAVYFELIDLRPYLRKREVAQTEQSRTAKELKDKAKLQRAEAYKKAKKDTDKSVKPAPPAPAPVASSKKDDDVNDKAFAQQFASVKQGTNLNAPKKSDEKRQKSVKQSRIQKAEKAEKAEEPKVSAPSSNAGGDADVSESPFASPEVQAADASGVADMLEPETPAPSVLRLTDTDKVKQKPKKAPKAPEKVETKKQRQNRQKAEAEKALRAETEKDSSVNGDYVAVQPLDTFATNGRPEPAAPKPAAAAPKVDNWKTPSLSEEEQMELLRDEEAWSTVKTKKSKAKKTDTETAESANESETSPAQTAVPQPAAPKPVKTGGAKPSVKFSQQSSFAALSTNDKSDEVEQEWDV